MRALNGIILGARNSLVALTLAYTPFSASAQPPVSTNTSAPPSEFAKFRLVRCNAHHAEMCLSAALTWPAGNSVPETLRWSAELLGSPMVGPEQFAIGIRPGTSSANVIHPVFAAPVLPLTSIGRVALNGTIALRDTADATRFVVQASWRPPRVAWPLFTGLADEDALPTALREALAIAAEPPSARPLISLLLLLSGIMLIGFVPRYLWHSGRESEEDVARQLASARALLTSQELEGLRNTAPREATPRAPDESTARAIEKPDGRP